jgi:hypothetical protein
VNFGSIAHLRRLAVTGPPQLDPHDEQSARDALGYARGTHRRVSFWVEGRDPATSAPLNEARPQTLPGGGGRAHERTFDDRNLTNVNSLP